MVKLLQKIPLSASWSASPPKSDGLLLVEHSTPVKIRQISSATYWIFPLTDKPTDVKHTRVIVWFRIYVSN